MSRGVQRCRTGASELPCALPLQLAILRRPVLYSPFFCLRAQWVRISEVSNARLLARMVFVGVEEER